MLKLRELICCQSKVRSAKNVELHIPDEQQLVATLDSEDLRKMSFKHEKVVVSDYRNRLIAVE